ncbi:MFS transporter [Paenibacillus chitinolyticus]|uniref:MFS transporter n=1 Tax=Paenibacillus chitinolyticus TaxID=79263 RepID=UPI003651BE74
MKKRYVLIFLTVLAAMTSIATFNPILGLLARSMGLSEIQTGSLVSVTGLFWITGTFLWAKWARVGRKPVMIAALLGYIATLAAFAVLSDLARSGETDPTGLYIQLLFLRAAGGFFFGAIPAMAQNYLMEWTTAENRASGMALFGAANGLGFVLGPALGALLTPVGLTAPMYASAVLLTLTAAAFWLMIPGGQPAVAGTRAGKLSAADPRISLYLAIGLTLSIVMIILQVTCGIFIQDRLSVTSQDAARYIGLGLSSAGVLVVVIQLLIGRYLKWPTGRLLKIGLSSLCAAFLLFLFWPAMYLLVFLLFGIGIGFTLPGYITAASLAVTEEEQPSVASFTAAVQGVGSFAGPLTGTLLYSLHTSVPYAVCVLLTAAFVLAVGARTRRGAVRQVASTPPDRTR